jgi:uncharacterized phage protein gp47/JayE
MPLAITTTPDVKYTDKEQEAIFRMLVQLFKTRHPGVVTDFASSNVVTAILDALATIGDQTAYYQDAQAREVFPTTAKLRSSLTKYAASIGYQPRSRVAATAQVRITLVEDSAFDTLIPSGSIFFTADTRPLRFRSLGDATLPAGAAGDSILIYVEHSESILETFVADGTPFKPYTTSRFPVLQSGIDDLGDLADDVIAITLDTIPVTIVPNFDDSEPTSLHARTEFDNDGRLIVIPGDGRTGVAFNGILEVRARTGGGEIGNGARITQGPSLSNNNGDPVALSFSNSVLSSGGADEESLEEIRIQAPLSLQSNNRTVSYQDFITNTESVPGIDRALPFTSNEDPTVEENATEVVVLTDSPTNAQLIGGNTAVTSMTTAVDDRVRIQVNGESTKTFDLGSQVSGEDIAAALQAAIRAETPDFPLDTAEAYSGFLVEFDTVNQRYILTNGLAGLPSSIEVVTGSNDATANMKLTLGTRASNTLGASPSAGTIAAVLQVLTVDKPVMVTHDVEVFGPSIQPIFVKSTVRLAADVTTAAAKVVVRNTIRTNVALLFSPRLSTGIANPEMDFGATIRFSDVISIINNTEGVESVDEDLFYLNDTSDDVVVDVREFPVLVGVEIKDASTGQVI